MKIPRICLIAITTALAFCLFGCTTSSNTDNENTGSFTVNANTIEELEALVEKDIEDTINNRNAELDTLKAEVDTYNKYVGSDAVKEFYEETYAETELLCTRLYDYALKYTEIIMASDMSYGEKYEAIEGLYELIYEDAGESVYDGIYDGVLENMYDFYYNGVIEDAYDNVRYDEWYEAKSDEYDLWFEAKSDVYDIWFDTKSDIYDFYFDVRSELWDKDGEGLADEVDDFRSDIEKLKGEQSEQEKK